MFLVTTWFGAFLLEDGEVREARAFPRDPAALAERLAAVRRGEVLAEERELAPEGPFQVAEERLAVLEGADLVEVAPDVSAEAERLGFGDALLHEATLLVAEAGMRKVHGSRDRHVMQAVDALDDLHQEANHLMERLREWYGLHFPELDRVAGSPERYAALVAQHGDRDAIAGALDLDASRSVGGPLDDDTREVLRHLARATSNLFQARAQVDRYLDLTMPEVAPNVTALVGPAVAARLVRLAGGLEDLAKLPSGTVQTLGAEKALFRHLREGTRPPKHGVLYQVPVVHRAPPQQRGPIARALAGKVSLAARADALTGNDVAEELQADLDARVREIRREHRGGKRGR